MGVGITQVSYFYISQSVVPEPSKAKSHGMYVLWRKEGMVTKGWRAKLVGNPFVMPKEMVFCETGPRQTELCRV